MNNKIQLPIRTFESFSETLDNSNFHPVKILICHTGENLNGSVFSIDSFNKSINTLSNIPILGFVKMDDNGNKDFAGHEIDVDIFVDEDDGKIKVREYYKEVPIGVIPETNNYFYEEIDGETYLGCYGYIWKSYSNDAYDILMEDEEKEVSMEIMIKECSYDKKNRCNIDKFEFLGVTVLGSAYPGAMGRECTVNMNFSANEEQEFFQAVERLNKILKTQGKEDIVMDNMEEKDLLVEFAEEEEKEVCPECGKEPCECEKEEEFAEEVEEETTEFEEVEETEEFAEVCPNCGKEPCECEEEEKEEEFAEEDKEEVCPECGKEPCECKEEEFSVEEETVEFEEVEETVEFTEEVIEEEIEEEVKEDFALSFNNLYRAISMSFDNITYQYTSFWGDTFDCRKYYLEDVIPSENVAIVYDDEDGKCYGVTYTMDNDDVVCNLESKVQYIKEWRPRVEGSRIFEVEDKDKVSVSSIYDMVEEELHSLREYKHQIEEAEMLESLKQEIEGILSTFSFEDEEIADLKEKALNREIDLEKFEDKLCVLEVKKMRSLKFSKASNESNSLPITDMEENKPKGKYHDLLSKYGRK